MVNFSEEWETMLATEIHFKVVGSCAPCSEYCLSVCLCDKFCVCLNSRAMEKLPLGIVWLIEYPNRKLLSLHKSRK